MDVHKIARCVRGCATDEQYQELTAGIEKAVKAECKGWEKLAKAEEVLKYIATYRNGFDGTEAGRLGLVAHEFLTSR